VHALFSLPHVPSTEPGRVVQLPPPTTRLPRAKPLPQAKPPTKWEQFAKIKGIQKRKRSRMVWDETLQKYMPRWGFKRAGSVDQVWAVEHKGEGADDPWTREERERKERVAKNEKQRQRNILRAAGGDRVPGTLDLTSVRPAKRLKRGAAKDDGEDAAEMAALGKSAPAAAKASHHVDVALQVAQRSTASMGIFDGELRNEPKRKLPRDAPRATAPPVDVKSERQFSLKLLKRIVGGDEGDEVDLSRAVSRVQAEKETARRDAKVVAARAGATKRRGKQ
jgi:regulator of ribosome biosynthesis